MKTPLILVVDDVEGNLKLIGDILRSIDVELSFATSGKKALSILKEITPDLIILDVLMPNMNGFELCEKIWELGRCKDVPIIFLSAKNSTEDIIQGFNIGARDYIAKPIIKEELLARVKAQLTLKLRSDDLRGLVKDNTKKLEETNIKLSDYNTALQVILEKREKDKDEIEKRVLSNVEEVIIPLIILIKGKCRDKKLKQQIELLEKNIEKIVSPFISDLKAPLATYGLTNREWKIIKLIRQGLTTPEIADTLNSSEHTIAYHRNNIRKKLKISNKRVNLETYLSQIDYNN